MTVKALLDGSCLLTSSMWDSGKHCNTIRKHQDHRIAHMQPDSIIARNDIRVSSSHISNIYGFGLPRRSLWLKLSPGCTLRVCRAGCHIGKPLTWIMYLARSRMPVMILSCISHNLELNLGKRRPHLKC